MISNVISIEDMLKSYGEEATVALLSSFSCARDGVQKNEEVENFVRKNVMISRSIEGHKIVPSAL